jgi:hypothetical protein
MMRRWRLSLGWPAVAVLVLALTGVFSPEPLVDTLSGDPVTGSALAFTPAYLVLAPIGAVLDQLSLLTDRQHIALIVSLLVVFAAWRVARHVFDPARRRSILRETLLCGGALAAIVAVYAFGVLGRRPMAYLRVSDPDVAIVDFHAHTEASHDGRSGFDADATREWHRSAGFDVVYVTDHATVEAARAATGENPALAGGGTSLLVGSEVRYKGQHVLVLGSDDPSVDDTALDPWPVLIQTLPNDLSRVPVPDDGDHGGVEGIELLDADPRGLRQSVEERGRILAIADSLDLALIAGSNNHGWGRTAAGWTLMRIPGWRDQPPEQVGREIEALIRVERAGATQVVERRRLGGGSSGGSHATADVLSAVTILPRLIWHILVSLTLRERLAWLAWVGIGALLTIWLRGPAASVAPGSGARVRSGEATPAGLQEGR